MDLVQAMAMAAKGMKAQGQRMKVISENLVALEARGQSAKRLLDPLPGTVQDDRGVAAGYLDLLYSFKNVSPVLVTTQQNPKGFDIVYGPTYKTLTSGNATIPGLLDDDALGG